MDYVIERLVNSGFTVVARDSDYVKLRAIEDIESFEEEVEYIRYRTTVEIFELTYGFLIRVKMTAEEYKKYNKEPEEYTMTDRTVYVPATTADDIPRVIDILLNMID